MTADDILNYGGDASLALGTGGQKGLAPGTPQFPNAIPAWMNVAQQELKMREAQYKKHQEDLDKLKSMVANDKSFDQYKIFSPDTDALLKERNDVVNYGLGHATQIANDPSSEEARTYYEMRNKALARFNLSAQYNAQDEERAKTLFTQPNLYDRNNFDQQKAQVDAMPIEQRPNARFAPNQNVTLDFMKMVKEDRPIFLNTDETFTGKTDQTGNYLQTSTNEQVPTDKIQELANSRWLENKRNATIAYANLKPDDLVNDAIAHGYLTLPKGQTVEGLTPQQKQNIIQTYSPNAEAWFKNSYITPMTGANVKMDYKGRIFPPGSAEAAKKPDFTYQINIPLNAASPKGTVTQLTDKNGVVRYDVKDETGQTMKDAKGNVLTFTTKKEADEAQLKAGGTQTINTLGGWIISGIGEFPSNVNILASQRVWDLNGNKLIQGKDLTIGSETIDGVAVVDTYVNPNGNLVSDPQNVTSQKIDDKGLKPIRVTQIHLSNGGTYTIPYDKNVSIPFENALKSKGVTEDKLPSNVEIGNGQVPKAGNQQPKTQVQHKKGDRLTIGSSNVTIQDVKVLNGITYFKTELGWVDASKL